ncbi:ToxD-like protein [Fusarium sp. NRRL 25303]|nr:ToxD-like protein [Fusarium sp. NRRL 25303]
MNKCIFVDDSCDLSIRDIPETYHPKDGQALVKVEYSGINPADLNHPKDLGMKNNVCGYEICGTVIETGRTSRYAVGDVVFGSNHPGRSKPGYHGGHQDFVILESNLMSAKLPAQLPRPDAAALSIMVRSAADALLNHFEIPFPDIGVSGPTPTEALLVWGGASSVGNAAIQLAKAMGVKWIFTTASPANHEALLELGATKCFNYRDPNVVDAIKASCEETSVSIRYVLDTVCKTGSPGTIQQCEAIATAPDVTLVSTLPQFSKPPRWRMVFASRETDNPVPFEFPGGNKANPVWEARLERAVVWAAMNYGTQFRIPHVKIVEGAEEGIQAIKDVNEGKISLTKVVIKHPL